MKLTRRQEEFVENLIILAQELNGPIHYSMLAERLGVSPFTAYDMLRLLEKKGLVTSEYQVAEGKSGPGRAERLFFPVMRPGQQLVNKFGTIPADLPDLKRFILDRFELGQMPEQAVAEELLSRIPPDGPEPIRYCLELMTAIGIRLRHDVGHQQFSNHLAEILPDSADATPARLSLLGGYAFGVLAQEDNDSADWPRMLLEHLTRYQEIVHCLTPLDCRQLADELKTIFSPLEIAPK